MNRYHRIYVSSLGHFYVEEASPFSNFDQAHMDATKSLMEQSRGETAEHSHVMFITSSGLGISIPVSNINHVITVEEGALDTVLAALNGGIPSE